MANYNHYSKYRHKISENRKLYSKYNAMKARCYRKTSPKYANYGARGITVCDEWIDIDTGFDAFADWSLSHGYQDDLTLERIDVNKGYSPENCKWIDRLEQAYNKTNTLWVDYHGEHIQLSLLCKRLGVNYQSVHFRLNHMGMSVQDAVEIPKHENVTEFAMKCHEHNIPIKVVKDRIRKLGWDEERALTTPPRKMRKRTTQDRANSPI